MQYCCFLTRQLKKYGQLMTIIHGNKITLRPYRIEDAEIMFPSFADATLNRLTGTQQTFTLEQVQRYIKNFETADDRVGFIIANPESPDLAPLGEIVILDIDEVNRSAGLRIAMYDMGHVNKGYGTEALQLVLDYAFTTLKLHRVWLDVFDFNERAVHVYEKIGFKHEGVQRDTLFYDGEFHNSVLMAILEDEWRTLQNE